MLNKCGKSGNKSFSTGAPIGRRKRHNAKSTLMPRLCIIMQQDVTSREKTPLPGLTSPAAALVRVTVITHRILLRSNRYTATPTATATTTGRAASATSTATNSTATKLLPPPLSITIVHHSAATATTTTNAAATTKATTAKLIKGRWVVLRLAPLHDGREWSHGSSTALRGEQC